MTKYRNLAPGQHVPFSGLVQAHTPGERRAFAPAATEDSSRPHPKQGFCSCVSFPLGQALWRRTGRCCLRRALVLGTRSYTSVAAILKNRRERAPNSAAELPLLIHENIRGPDYYH